MKLKSWLKNLVFILLLVGAVFLQGYLQKLLQNDYVKSYKFNYLILTGFTLATVLIGVILGLDHIFNEKKKEGSWSVNVPKLVLMGIPSLYASIIYYLASVNNQTVYKIFVNPVFKFFGSSTLFITVFQIIFGYVIITAFYKRVKQNVAEPSSDSFAEEHEIDGEEGPDEIEEENDEEKESASEDNNDHDMW
jgi:hypothetical protein